MTALTQVILEEGASIEPAQVVVHLAQAEAALMVVECLMTVLIEQKILAKDAIIAAVDTVIETKRNMIIEHQHAPIAMIAVGLLSTFSNSLAATG